MTAEFVAGTLIGKRAYWVDDNGWLQSIHVPSRLKPGVNQARCALHIHSKDVIPALTCRCGHYAYTRGQKHNIHHSPSSTLEAIVEGSGRAIVATNGFRVEKLRLIALVRPSRSARLDAWMHKRQKLVSTVFFTLVALALFSLGAIVATASPWPVFPFVGSTLIMIVIAFTPIAHTTSGERQLVKKCRLISENYPDVKWYPSLKAATRAHPLTDTLQYTSARSI